MSRVVGYALAAVAVVLIIVYGSIALYRGSWDLANANAVRSNALAQKNANAQQKIIQHGSAMQAGLKDDFDNQFTAETGLTATIAQTPAAGQQPIIDQRLAIANKMCADASQMDSVRDLGAASVTWVHTHCAGPVVAANDSLRKGS